MIDGGEKGESWEFLGTGRDFSSGVILVAVSIPAERRRGRNKGK